MKFGTNLPYTPVFILAATSLHDAPLQPSCKLGAIWCKPYMRSSFYLGCISLHDTFSVQLCEQRDFTAWVDAGLVHAGTAWFALTPPSLPRMCVRLQPACQN